MIDRPDPQRIYDIFKAEDTAEHKTKDRGKDSGCRYDPGQRKPFKMIDQSSHDHQEQSLSHITEHNAENKGISKSYKHCGIHLIMRRKAIHTHKHFKGPEDLWILQFGRRLPEIIIVVIFHYNKHFIVILCLFHELFYVVIRHPAAQNIIIFFFIFHPGCHLAHIKIVSQLLQAFFCSHKFCSLFCEQLCFFLFNIADLFLDIKAFFCQFLADTLRCSPVRCRYIDPLKMQGPKYCVYFVGFRRRNKVSAVYHTFILLPFDKNSAQIVHQKLFHFLVLLCRKFSKTVGDIFIT